MIQVDKSNIKGEYRNEATFMPELEEFLEKVALAKPLCKFEVHDNDVRKVHSSGDEAVKTTYLIHRVRVLENGENLGGISIEDRWRDGKYEKAYGVSSFRISKERGRYDTALTKDIKVALRTAKKAFLARENDELKTLIKDNVTQEVVRVHGTLGNTLRWDMTQDAEMVFYAMQAWRARTRGEHNASMPAVPVSVRNIAEHDKKCEHYEQMNELFNMLKAKQGYGVLANLDNSITVYAFATDTIFRFDSFETMPQNIQEKYAMFKVLQLNEPVATIGMKLTNNFAFVAE